MPELPEVETIVRDLRPRLTGRRIVGATLRFTDVLRGVTKAQLERGLTGADIAAVSRRAKHAVLHLGARRLVVQPGMTGSLIVYGRPLTAAEAKYAVLRARLDDGHELVYRDVRRLGTLLLLDEAAWAAYDGAIGPEPLESGFTPESLHATMQRSAQAVKKVIMDQKHLAGVGNIYANEALFASGIDPSRAASTLTRSEATALHGHIHRILSAAIASQGTTFRDYRTGTGERGNFQLALHVYGREGAPCTVCGTPLAGTHSIDARITVFCWRCQR